MINTVLEQVKGRKFFYRGIYLRALNILIAVLVLEIILTLLAAYLVVNRHVPSFYASSSDGILTPLKAMREPNRSQKAMLE